MSDYLRTKVSINILEAFSMSIQMSCLGLIEISKTHKERSYERIEALFMHIHIHIYIRVGFTILSFAKANIIVY